MIFVDVKCFESIWFLNVAMILWIFYMGTIGITFFCWLCWVISCKVSCFLMNSFKSTKSFVGKCIEWLCWIHWDLVTIIFWMWPQFHWQFLIQDIGFQWLQFSLFFYIFRKGVKFWVLLVGIIFFYEVLDVITYK